MVSTVDCASKTTAACDAVKVTTWTGVDSISTKGDCIADSFSNTLSSGKYGCNFGNLTAAGSFGRFVPDHFDTVITQVGGVPMPCPTGLTCPVLYYAFVYSASCWTRQPSRSMFMPETGREQRLKITMAQRDFPKRSP